MDDAEQLAVGPPELVGGVEPLARLGEDVRDDRQREAVLVIGRDRQEARERLPRDVLHREEDLARRLAVVERSG